MLEGGIESKILGAKFADELFFEGSTRELKTRKEKHENNYRFVWG